ncbi:conserved membrane hypothetical protein [Candidatus Sulfopaludibacter sp. SbA4]|nr:conserved membrane hypothetical protein [Candidatus Sulfopaludibacter sp. SbA4]
MPQQTYLTPGSILFWLTGLLAIGIIFIGARFIIAPLPAARDFGVPAPETKTRTYLWTKGTRDIVSGLFVMVLPGLKVASGVLAVFLFVASLIPFGDMLNVWASVRRKNVPALVIHGGTGLFMCVLASLILRCSHSRLRPGIVVSFTIPRFDHSVQPMQKSVAVPLRRSGFWWIAVRRAERSPRYG